LGANVRSLFTEENFYFLHKTLLDRRPDILFLVETWHSESNTKALLDRKYRIMLSESDQERGGGVAILFKSTLQVISLFKEFHERNLLLARLSSASAFPVLLMCVYVPPDQRSRKNMLAHVARVLDFLRSRYHSFGLIAFGDLNINLRGRPESSQCKRWDLLTRNYGLKTYYKDEKGLFTRTQGTKSSYLDYFFGCGVQVEDLSVGEKFGASDHHVLSMVTSSFAPVKRRRQVLFSKDRARRELVAVLQDEEFKHDIVHLSPQSLFHKLSSKLRECSMVFEPKPKSLKGNPRCRKGT